MQRSYDVMVRGSSSSDSHCAKRLRVEEDLLRTLDAFLFPPARFARALPTSIVGADALLAAIVDAPSILFTDAQLGVWVRIGELGGFVRPPLEGDALHIRQSGFYYSTASHGPCSRTHFAEGVARFFLDPGTRFEALTAVPFAFVAALMFFQAEGERTYSARSALMQALFDCDCVPELRFWADSSFALLQTPEVLRFMCAQSDDTVAGAAAPARTFDSAAALVDVQRRPHRALAAFIHHLLIRFCLSDAEARTEPLCWKRVGLRLVQPFFAMLQGVTDAPAIDAMCAALSPARLHFLDALAQDARAFLYQSGGGSAELRATFQRVEEQVDAQQRAAEDVAHAVLSDAAELAVPSVYAPVQECDIGAHCAQLRSTAQVLDLRALAVLERHVAPASLVVLSLPGSVRASHVRHTVAFFRAALAGVMSPVGSVHVSFVEQHVCVAASPCTVHSLRLAMLCHSLRSAAASALKPMAVWPLLTTLYTCSHAADDAVTETLARYTVVLVLAHWLGVRSHSGKMFSADGVPSLRNSALFDRLHTVVELLWPGGAKVEDTPDVKRLTALRNFLLLERRRRVKVVALRSLIGADPVADAVLRAVLQRNGYSWNDDVVVSDDALVPLCLEAYALCALLPPHLQAQCTTQASADEIANVLFYRVALAVGGAVGGAALMGVKTHERYAPPKRPLYSSTRAVVFACEVDAALLPAGFRLRSDCGAASAAKLAPLIRALELSVCADSPLQRTRIRRLRALREMRPQQAHELAVGVCNGAQTLHWVDSFALVDSHTERRAVFSDVPRAAADACLNAVDALCSEQTWSAEPHATLEACRRVGRF